MFSNIKKTIRIIVTIVILGLLVTSIIGFSNASRWKSQWEIAKNNEKAFSEQLTSAREDIMVYKFTMEQMRYIKDSTIQKMTHIIDSLKLKDKNIQQVQYVETVIHKTDTLRLKDTLFLEPDLCLDTILGDSWISSRLHLEYPSLITISPSVKSEKICIVSLKKETINPPKKTWIGRLFQRKHKVARVNVVEQNPYVVNQQSMFIEVIK